MDQPECLELLIADGGSSDGSIEYLESMAARDRRVRIVSRADNGPANALNQAFQHARGKLIGWLNADDLYPPGALTRAAKALEINPKWLMVYGEGQEFKGQSREVNRYPTLPASVGLEGFRSHCFICQPTVVFRRSMTIMLGPFDGHWRTAFDFDYWLRAFSAFPERIGYLPQLQGLTRLHTSTITSRHRAEVALEATELLARHFGSADAVRLHGYALELQEGIAILPTGQTVQDHLRGLFNQAAPWLDPNALSQLKDRWLACEDKPCNQINPSS
jgi:glycosyltransferase involved in cell wall biosynthesis